MKADIEQNGIIESKNLHIFVACVKLYGILSTA
jgi:hypothetical protein